MMMCSKMQHWGSGDRCRAHHRSRVSLYIELKNNTKYKISKKENLY